MKSWIKRAVMLAYCHDKISHKTVARIFRMFGLSQA